MEDLKNTTIKRICGHELDLAFYISIKRRVKNDATISVNGTLYEVPHTFMGKIIELRYPSDKHHTLTIYENDKPVCAVKRLNLQENASPPSWGIRFDQKGNHND